VAVDFVGFLISQLRATRHLYIISAAVLVFVNLGDLTIISSFASSTFLLIFASINYSAFRLRQQIVINPITPLAGVVLSLTVWLVLCGYLWQHDRRSLMWMAVFYLGVAGLEFLFSQRRWFFTSPHDTSGG